MCEVAVHQHALKHGLSQEDVLYAWENFIRRQPRGVDVWAAIGFDAWGRELEMVAVVQSDGSLLIIHALSPATLNMKRELGLDRRQGWSTR